MTQTCLGMSRDDSGSFLGAYSENEIVKKNPFALIDQTGGGQLIQIAAAKGNKTRPGIKLGPAIAGRRTRRRTDHREILSRHRFGLRQLLAVPRSDHPSRCCPSSAG